MKTLFLAVATLVMALNTTAQAQEQQAVQDDICSSAKALNPASFGYRSDLARDLSWRGIFKKDITQTDQYKKEEAAIATLPGGLDGLKTVQRFSLLSGLCQVDGTRWEPLSAYLQAVGEVVERAGEAHAWAWNDTLLNAGEISPAVYRMAEIVISMKGKNAS